MLNKRGRLELKSGNRFQKLFTIFASPIQPELNDYYEPWTYDYQNLTSAPLGDDFPAAKPVSLITGEDTKVEWGYELGRQPGWCDRVRSPGPAG